MARPAAISAANLRLVDLHEHARLQLHLELTIGRLAPLMECCNAAKPGPKRAPSAARRALACH